MRLTMWTELPQDIVEFISKKLLIYADYVRFRCVCRRWRHYTPEAPLHLPTQLPWLMLSHNSFFDLSTNKIHQLDLDPYCIPGTIICGSSHGWLVVADKISELCLLNPITLATISLPRLNPHYYQNSTCLIKVVLSSSPSSDEDFTAFALLHGNRFAFYRKGYDSWVVLNWGCNGKDAIYKNGSFFVVDTNGKIAVFNVDRLEMSRIDMNRISTTYPIEMIGFPLRFTPLEGPFYLVSFKEDMLLVIPLYMYEAEGGHENGGLHVRKTAKFKIHKMNWNVRKWEQIQSLGEHSLFIGTKSSFCCCAADFVGFRPNCIYFTNYIYGEYFGIYSLSNESIDLLPGYPQTSCTNSVWVAPTPYSNLTYL